LDRSLLCEFGDDPLVQCNALASCGVDGAWIVSGPPDVGDSGCPTVLPPACPSTFAAAEDASVACSPSLLFCTYPDGMCACDPDGFTPDGGAYAYAWTCSAPPASGCPSTRPRFGTACTGASTCAYTTYPCGSYESACSCGAWRRAECPAVVGADNTLL